MSESVLLIQPPPFLIRNVDYPAHLLHLGSFLESKGIGIAIKALASLHRPKKGPIDLKTSINAIERLLADHPAATTVAIASWSSFEYIIATILCSFVKNINPDIQTVVGGYHPSVLPNEFTTTFLKDNPFPLEATIPIPDKINEIATVTEDNQQLKLQLNINEKEPIVNSIITGEGEIALYNCVINGEHYHHRQQVIRGEPIGSMDDTSIKWDLLGEEIGKWLETHPMIIYLSRGCPFSCKFCCTETQTKHTRMWRPYSPKRAVQVLNEAYDRFTPKIVSIGDPCFGFHQQWRKKFLEELAKADFSKDFGFAVATRINGTSKEDLQLFSKFQCMITFGVEHADPYMLRLMNKTRRPELFIERVKRVIDDCIYYGVLAEIQLIMGFPGETERSLKKWILFWRHLVDKFMESNGLIQVNGWPFQFLPGSDIQRNRYWYEEKLGTKILIPNWWRFITEKRYDMARMVIPSKYLSFKNYDTFFRHWQNMKNTVMRLATDFIEDLEIGAKLQALYRSEYQSKDPSLSPLIGHWESKRNERKKAKWKEINEIIDSKLIAALEPEEEIDFLDQIV